jgi:hypothetical protein
VSNTAHLAVRDAIIAALLAVPALAGGRVVGNRRRPMAQEHNAQVFVYLEDAVASRELIGTTDWHTRIRIECLARATSTTSADDAADALAFSAYARIMADPSLAGNALDTEPQAMAWNEDEADPALSACQQIFTVWHKCQDTTLSA